MGYKILGYIVWRAGKWYVRRRAPNLPRNAAIAVATLLLLGGAGAVVANRRGQS
jgi:predicted PurR-regulated permease PerM